MGRWRGYCRRVETKTAHVTSCYVTDMRNAVFSSVYWCNKLRRTYQLISSESWGTVGTGKNLIS